MINAEGDPDHPISEGCLCPKGGSTYQIAVNDNRLKKVRYRAPNSNKWKEVSWEWALGKIAANIKKSRDKSFTGKECRWKGRQQDQRHRFCRQRSAGQRRMLALPENAQVAWTRLYRASGPNMTQRNCSGSGRVVRSRRNDKPLYRFQKCRCYPEYGQQCC